MSDADSQDDFIMEEDDGEEFDFEYEDGDDASGSVASGESRGDSRGAAAAPLASGGGAVDLENRYYAAKNRKDDDPAAAAKQLETVIALEQPAGTFGFRATKQLLKLALAAGRSDEVVERYRALLNYASEGRVPRAQAEKSVGNMLQLVSKTRPAPVLEQIYRATLQALESGDWTSERLWTRAQLKLASLWLAQGATDQALAAAQALRRRCEVRDGESGDQSRGALLLEIYALEIQLYSALGKRKELQQAFRRASSVRGAIAHPLVHGVIRECGGKLAAASRQFAHAQSEFFEAFRNYDEAGAPERLRVLGYLVVASLLSESGINPFDSQETKPYVSEPALGPAVALVAAFHARQLATVDELLRGPWVDAFLQQMVPQLLFSLRAQVVCDMVRPYACIDVAAAAEQLLLTIPDSEHLFVRLILEGRLPGSYDQLLQRYTPSDGGSDPLGPQLDRWADSLSGLFTAVCSKAV